MATRDAPLPAVFAHSINSLRRGARSPNPTEDTLPDTHRDAPVGCETTLSERGQVHERKPCCL